jgi:PleD family two-component response regulator
MKNQRKSVVLLVDDRPANILVLEKLLEKNDRIFLTAASGQEALKLALSKEIDLIILDVQMPEMDGFEVSQILKSNKRTNDIPIIFASAEKKEHKFMMKGFEEGAVDYLFKPLDPEITKAKVAVLLKLQMQKKELIEKNISLERSALLINNSADIIGIIDASTLRFQEVNQAFTSHSWVCSKGNNRYVAGFFPE